jgi:hypothetical protein
MANNFSADNAAKINSQVSTMFGMNIISTQPVDVANPGTGASTDSKNYALVLAAVSQLLKTENTVQSTTLQDVLTKISDNIISTTQTMTMANPALITTPLNQFVGSSNNGTGITTAPAITAPAVNVSKATIKLRTSGFSAGQLVSAIQATLLLPTGVTPSGLVGNNASASLTVSGVAVGIANTLNGASYDPATRFLNIGQISAPPGNGGMPVGEFLTISCDVAAGADLTSFPAQATITAITDSNGTPISGATCPASVTFQ